MIQILWKICLPRQTLMLITLISAILVLDDLVVSEPEAEPLFRALSAEQRASCSSWIGVTDDSNRRGSWTNCVAHLDKDAGLVHQLMYDTFKDRVNDHLSL